MLLNVILMTLKQSNFYLPNLKTKIIIFLITRLSKSVVSQGLVYYRQAMQQLLAPGDYRPIKNNNSTSVNEIE